MATVTKKKVLNQATFGGTPYGNLSVLSFNLTTNASGVYVDSDQATAIAIGDKVRLGVLPAGMKLMDALFIVSDAFTALVTADIGFEYVDGVDSTSVPQDADYFGTAIALNTQGRYPADNAAVAPVVLPKDAYLIVTTAGANCAAVGVADILIKGVQTGAP
jgi:hypothetical protein